MESQFTVFGITMQIMNRQFWLLFIAQIQYVGSIGVKGEGSDDAA